MSEWGWVAFAFVVTYGSMAGFAAWSGGRLRRLRRRLEEGR